jgi:hypothetical protein
MMPTRHHLGPRPLDHRIDIPEPLANASPAAETILIEMAMIERIEESRGRGGISSLTP